MEEANFEKLMSLGEDIESIGSYINTNNIKLELIFNYSGSIVYDWRATKVLKENNKTIDEELNYLLNNRIPNAFGNNDLNITSLSDTFNDPLNSGFIWDSNESKREVSSISKTTIRVDRDSDICPGFILFENGITNKSNLQVFIKSLTLAIGSNEDNKIKEIYERLLDITI